MPACPSCEATYTYEQGELFVCPSCSFEWPKINEADAASADERIIKDSVGNQLFDGDTVTIAKDLKVKGSSTSIKVGTKVRNIRLVNGPDGHDIDAKVDGFGSMLLKSSVVKKVL